MVVCEELAMMTLMYQFSDFFVSPDDYGSTQLWASSFYLGLIFSWWCVYVCGLPMMCLSVWAEFLFWASGPMINVTSYHLRQFVCLLVCNCFWSPMSHVLHLNVIFWLSVVRLCGNASRIPPRSEVQVKLIIMFVCLLVWNLMKFDKVFMLDLNTAFAVAFFAGW